MNCKNCGNPLSEDALFCTNCGCKVEPDTTENPEAVIPESPKPDETAPKAPVLPENSYDGKPENNFSNPAPEPRSEYKPAPEAIPAEPEKPAKLTGGRVAGAVGVSVFAVVFLLVFNLILCARIGLSSDIVKSSADSMSIETLLDLKCSDDQTISEYIYDNIEGDFITGSNAEVKDIRAVVINSDFKSFFVDSIADYAAYIVDGSKSKDPSLSADDITEFFEDNEDVFKEELGYNMSDEDYEQLSESLEDDGIADALSIDSWSDTVGINFGITHYFLSYITIGIVLALVIVLFIWIAIIFDKRHRNILGFFRTNLLIPGLIFFIPSVVFIIGSVIMSVYSESAVAYVCAKMLFPFAAVAACTGLFEIVVAFILGKIKKHIKK